MSTVIRNVQTRDMPGGDRPEIVSSLPGLQPNEHYEVRPGADGGSIVVRVPGSAAATADTTATAAITKSTDGRDWADRLNQANRQRYGQPVRGQS